MRRGHDLLVLNLATDADDPVLFFTTRWLQELAPKFARVDVVTMRKGRLDLPPNVAVHSLGKERGRTEAVRAAVFYGILASLVARFRYKACFAHQAPLFAAMAAPLLKARRIPSALWYAHGSVSRTLRIAERAVDTVVTSSPEGFRVPSDKVVVVGQGVDVEFFSPPAEPAIHDAPRRVLCVGRIAPVKGLDLFVDTMAELAGESGAEPIEGRLVGPTLPEDHAYGDALRERVVRHGLGDIVRFVGPLGQLELLAEYKQADLILNPSRTGSLDKVVLEAMSCGKPVISANPPYEPVLRRIHPSLYVGSDRPGDVVSACQEVLRMSADERSTLGARLRQVVVRDHSLERLMDRLTDEVLVS